MEKREDPNPEAKEGVDGVPKTGVEDGVPKADAEDGVPKVGLPKAEAEGGADEG